MPGHPHTPQPSPPLVHTCATERGSTEKLSVLSLRQTNKQKNSRRNTPHHIIAFNWLFKVYTTRNRRTRAFCGTGFQSLNSWTTQSRIWLMVPSPSCMALSNLSDPISIPKMEMIMPTAWSAMLLTALAPLRAPTFLLALISSPCFPLAPPRTISSFNN